MGWRGYWWALDEKWWLAREEARGGLCACWPIRLVRVWERGEGLRWLNSFILSHQSSSSLMGPAALAMCENRRGLEWARSVRYSRNASGKCLATSSSLSQVVSAGFATHCTRYEAPSDLCLLKMAVTPWSWKPVGSNGLRCLLRVGADWFDGLAPLLTGCGLGGGLA